MTTTATKPIERILNLFQDAKGPKGSGDWYTARCPSHQDKNPSFGFHETESGGVAFKCFGKGCTREQILQNLNLEEADLQGRGYKPSLKTPKPLEVVDLMMHKLLSPDFLSYLGLIEGSRPYISKETGKPYTVKGVIIPYYAQDGTPYARYRLRKSLTAKNGTIWNPPDESTEPPIPYGLQRLKDARNAGYIVIVEGESDCWTLWRHGFSALGIPGATNEKCLEASILDGIGRVYIVQEPDEAGSKFPNRVYTQLTKTGYKGRVYSVDFYKETGEKDPGDLHVKDVNAFKATFEALLQTARVDMSKQKQAKHSNALPDTFQDIPYLDTKEVLDLLPQAEYGDSLVFVSLFGDKLVYDHAEKSWYYWNGHSWKKDESKVIRQLVPKYVGKQYLDTASEIPRMVVGKSEEEVEKLGKWAKDCIKRAVDVRNLHRIDNITILATSHPTMTVLGHEWDSDPWVLGTPSGVIDLHTGMIQDGKPDDYIRTITNAEWTGIDTPCPRFERFLQEIFDDQPDKEELIRYLQRLLGYGITGLSREPVFPVLHGEEGRNGKSTLVRHLGRILGGIASAINNDVLIASRGRTVGSAQPYLADLQGKRLVWAQENAEGAKLDVAQVKTITGDDMIPARRLYENGHPFKATHTLFLLTNHKPHGDATDKALWERVKLIPFTLRFVEYPVQENDRQRDAILDTALEKEYSGILAWLVRGCLEYQRIGLCTPSCVRSATEAYQREEDTLEQFVEQECELGEAYTVDAMAFYLAYSAWAKVMNMYPMSGKAFGMRAKNRFKWKRTRQGVVYIGVQQNGTF